MQPSTRSKYRFLVIMALSAALVAIAALLVTLRANAAGTPSLPLHTAAAVGYSKKSDVANEVARDDTNKVIGVVAVAGAPAEGFLGYWQIQESGRLVTVVVTPDTLIGAGFDGVPPKAGAWVEAKGRPQADGTFLARKFRPNKFESGEVVARLTSTAVLTQVAQTYQMTPLTSLLASANVFRFELNEEVDEKVIARRLARDTHNFVWADLNYVSAVSFDTEGDRYRTWKWGSSDPASYVDQDAFDQVNLAPVAGQYEGTGVIVAVLDTGIDATHPVFEGRLLPGRDLVDGDDVPEEGLVDGLAGGFAVGHGTHVSGIVTRIAPQSKLLPVRVLDVDGRGNTYDLAYAIDWAVENGADVINMSLGCDFDATVLADAVARAQSNGVVIVAAAGNDDAEMQQYPAAYPGVLSITAVNNESAKASFANYGTDWVDLAAPGVGITSTVPVSGAILYGSWSGTSTSTPFVSGAAALARQHSPDAEPSAIAAILIDTGDDLDARNPSYVGKLGHLLNIGAALIGQPDATPETTPEATLEVTPAATPEATLEVTPEATPAATPEATPEATLEVTPDATPEATPDATPDPFADGTPDATPEPAPTPMPELIPAPKPEFLPENLFLPAVLNS